MSYRKRMLLARAKKRGESLAMQDTVTIDAEHIIREYEDAWKLVNGGKPSVKYRKGWYNVNGHNYRRSDIVKMTGVLQSRHHEMEISDAV